jgi:hypothetical protein
VWVESMWPVGLANYVVALKFDPKSQNIHWLIEHWVSNNWLLLSCTTIVHGTLLHTIFKPSELDS